MVKVRNVQTTGISLYDPTNGYFEVHIGDGVSFTALNSATGEMERFTCGPNFDKRALFYGISSLPSGLNFSILNAEVDIYVTIPKMTDSPQRFACDLFGGTVKDGERVIYNKDVKLKK